MNKKRIIFLLVAVIIIGLVSVFCWLRILNIAHSSFENYANFRGCNRLIERTDVSGTCQISSGEIIKIVKSDNKWYLDGDLPIGAKPDLSTTTTETATSSQIVYKNTDFGFTFSLPVSWKGFSIISDQWQGQMIDVADGQKITGPKISIRHPLWTAENPRQDIPIMVFTLAEWSLIQKESLSVSAAPIGPGELGRNSQYVFALPARYNFAYQTGFEEVMKIFESKPLHIEL